MDPKEKDPGAEEKIKIAARKIFTRKGFAATRTRDIAEEAGLNLALLNYYFRSKEKLFEIIMLENFGQFLAGLRSILHDTNTSLDQKIEGIVDFYITQLSLSPDLPFFVLNELRSGSSILKDKGFSRDILLRSHFIQQLKEELHKRNIQHVNPLHYVMNIFSMTIFPFVAAPLITEVGNLSEEDFGKLMQERKQWIPIWIKSILLAQPMNTSSPDNT
jgi:AcrR family transcriptional regulator